MGQIHVGEVRCFALGWAPRGWLPCDGRLLQIADPRFGALHGAIGNLYGGDGTATFALPDLRGRVPVSAGTLDRSAYAPGLSGGAEQVALSEANLPPHQHLWTASPGVATQPPPANAFLAGARSSGQPINAFSPVYQPVMLADDLVAATGGGEAHANVQPFVALGYCIAVEGVSPGNGEAGE